MNLLLNIPIVNKYFFVCFDGFLGINTNNLSKSKLDYLSWIFKSFSDAAATSAHKIAIFK